MSILFLISLYSIIVDTLCISRIPCYIENETCALETFKIIHNLIAEGIPALGIEDSDPIHQDKVIGIVPKLNYTLLNAEMAGLKNCEVKDVKIDVEQANFVLNLLCPQIIVRGNYNLLGEVLSIPVEGNGSFSIISDDVDYTFYAHVEKIKDGNDTEHYRITDFEQIVNSKSKDTYHFTNLYNGDQEKADRILKQANKNWKTVSAATQGPGFFGFFKVYLANINTYLESVALNQLFIYHV